MELRETLSAKYKELDQKTVKFNSLHREAKYLKKELVVIRREIAELEAKISRNAN